MENLLYNTFVITVINFRVYSTILFGRDKAWFTDLKPIFVLHTHIAVS